MIIALEVFWKSGVLLGAALCVNALLRKKSADVRRLVLSIAVVAMFVAALAWPVLPRWTAATPAWLRLGNPTPTTFEPAQPAVADSGTGVALPAIQTPVPESASRAERRMPDVIPLIWFGGTMLLLARFLIGLHGLRRLRLASEALSDSDLGANLDRRVTLLQNDSIAAPVTWGIVRPVILVPAGFEQLPNECREAVLCHELAHIQGYDFLLRGLAEIACALIWFQPLMRVVRRQLREEQELACDNRVLVAGGKASAYAKLLLDWDLRPGTDPLIAVGMAHRSCLKRRLYALLDEGQRRGRVARTGILATWFLGLATTLPLAAINLAPAVPVQPPVPQTVAEVPLAEQMPRIQFQQFPALPTRKATRAQLAQALPAPAPAPAPAPQTAAASVKPVPTPLPHFSSLTCLVVVDATVNDLSGKGIDGLTANDFVLTEDGREQMIRTFEFQKADGYYALGYYTMNCRGDGALRKIVIVRRGDTQARLSFREGYFVPNSAGESDTNVGAHFTANGVTDTESKTTLPTVIYKVDPEYTEQARKAKYQGTVALLVEIGATGRATSVTVIRSLGMGLDEKAVDAVTQWKFKPAAKNGQPVSTQVQVDLGFRLL